MRRRFNPRNRGDPDQSGNMYDRSKRASRNRGSTLGPVNPTPVPAAPPPAVVVPVVHPPPPASPPSSPIRKTSARKTGAKVSSRTLRIIQNNAPLEDDESEDLEPVFLVKKATLFVIVGWMQRNVWLTFSSVPSAQMWCRKYLRRKFPGCQFSACWKVMDNMRWTLFGVYDLQAPHGGKWRRERDVQNFVEQFSAVIRDHPVDVSLNFKDRRILDKGNMSIIVAAYWDKRKQYKFIYHMIPEVIQGYHPVAWKEFKLLAANQGDPEPDVQPAVPLVVSVMDEYIDGGMEEEEMPDCFDDKNEVEKLWFSAEWNEYDLDVAEAEAEVHMDNAERSNDRRLQGHAICRVYWLVMMRTLKALYEPPYERGRNLELERRFRVWRPQDFQTVPSLVCDDQNPVRYAHKCLHLLMYCGVFDYEPYVNFQQFLHDGGEGYWLNAPGHFMRNGVRDVSAPDPTFYAGIDPAHFDDLVRNHLHHE